MDIKLAVSRAGHDKDSIYVIVKEEADWVYLADGTCKPLEKPKKRTGNIFKSEKSFRKKLQKSLRRRIFGMKE